LAPISVTLAGREPPSAVVALVGEHDAYSSHRLESELVVLVEEGRRIVVDLRDATFIDSTTLSALLNGRNTADRNGLDLALVLSDESYSPVHQILDITGLRSEFRIFDDIDDALRSFRDREHVV
jgi:stage II sporulation protein AA (anti-sigma F factor antagonist)